MYRRIAIITGASSGIGKAFLELLARDNGELFNGSFDEIWAVARREDALNELAASVEGVKIVPVIADLSDISGIKIIEDKLKSEEPQTGLLINSAGMGIKGTVMEKSGSSISDTISLNCSALSLLTKAVVPFMKSENGKPGIINIASSAGFFPQPNFAVYAASKSYVISFSRAMSYELKPLGISVTTVCPGPVRTDFQRRATEGREEDFTDWRKNFVADPVKLAVRSLKASRKGKRMLVYPFSQKLLHLASKILPVSWILCFSGNLK